LSRVVVKRKLLDWALRRSNKTIDSLEKSFPKIRGWFDGSIQPTVTQLGQFANKTHTPFGYFMLSEPPKDMLPIPFFRSMHDNKSSSYSLELLDTIYTMQRRQAWLREYLIENGNEGLVFVSSITRNKDPIDIAKKIKDILGLTNEWASKFKTWEEALKALFRIVENAGIVIVSNSIVANNTHRGLSYEEFRGFVLVDEYVPLIFINSSDFKSAQMFTIAHELAHVFLGSSAVFDLKELQPADDPTELLCNSIAAEFLVPEIALNNNWVGNKDFEKEINRLARRFKVSEIVIARRALDMNKINGSQFFEFYEMKKNYWTQRKVKNSESEGGPDFYDLQDKRVGKKYLSYIDQAVNENKLTYLEAYKLTGLYGRKYDELINRQSGLLVK
jgi:Zn-dependent peptidase ImmA (M78 family)